jgi:hypothetical protein
VLNGDFDKKIVASGVDRRLYVTLVEPVFEWTMKCIFEGANQVPVHIPYQACSSSQCPFAQFYTVLVDSVCVVVLEYRAAID